MRTAFLLFFAAIIGCNADAYGAVESIELKALLSRISSSHSDTIQRGKNGEIRRIWIPPTASLTDAELPLLTQLPALEELRLRRQLVVSKFTPAGLDSLAKISGLTSLDLRCCDVDDRDVKFLEGLKHLSNLDLYGTKVGDKTANRLRELKELKAIALGNTSISDAGLQDIARIDGLESLDVSFTAVTGDGLRRLRTLRHLHSLTVDERIAHSRGAIDLSRELPGLEVLGVGV